MTRPDLGGRHPHPRLLEPASVDDPPPLTPEDRDLIVRYMVLRALARLALGGGARSRPEPLRPVHHRRHRRRPDLRRIHGR